MLDQGSGCHVCSAEDITPGQDKGASRLKE